MRIGIMSGHGRQDEGVNALVAKAQDLEARGFDTPRVRPMLRWSETRNSSTPNSHGSRTSV